VAAAACLIASPPLAAQADRHVYVTVLDAGGAPIAGLTAEHFAVRESGRDRTVVGVAPVGAPMHLAVLVDTTVGNGMPEEPFRSAIADFVGRMATTHNVALYAFGNRAAQIVPFTQDGPRLRAAVSSMFAQAQGGSYLIDAIDLAVKDMAPLEAPRPVMLAIASEAADASRRTAGAAIKDLIKYGIAFHAVSVARGAGTPASRVSSDIPSSSQRLQGIIAAGEGDRERTRVLQQGTSVTGGGSQRVTTTTNLAPALSRVAAEFAGGYRLSFTGPPGDKALKDLQVGVLLEGVTLRATPAPGGKK
jgi:VWFA-related protein